MLWHCKLQTVAFHTSFNQIRGITFGCSLWSLEVKYTSFGNISSEYLLSHPQTVMDTRGFSSFQTLVHAGLPPGPYNSGARRPIMDKDTIWISCWTLMEVIEKTAKFLVQSHDFSIREQFSNWITASSETLGQSRFWELDYRNRMTVTCNAGGARG